MIFVDTEKGLSYDIDRSKVIKLADRMAYAASQKIAAVDPFQKNLVTIKAIRRMAKGISFRAAVAYAKEAKLLLEVTDPEEEVTAQAKHANDVKFGRAS